MDADSRARLQIRAKTYRGKAGFSISGTNGWGQRLRVFTITRSSAEHIRTRLRAGLDTRLEDFDAR